MDWGGGVFRYFRGARMARRGRRLLASGDSEQAKKVLGDALVLLGVDEPGGASVGVWFSERMFALVDLSCAAAQTGDVELARTCIRDGLALWDRGSLPPSENFAAIDEWSRWARHYLAWSARSGPPR